MATCKALAIAVVWVTGCSLPDLKKIHLADCIRQCNATSTECLGPGGGFRCPEADACFDGVTKCFDAATECSDKCVGCEKNFTCEKESTCLSQCSHQANECAGVIDDCVDYAQGCASAQVDAGKVCITGMVDCISSCIADTEAVLRGQK